MTKGKDITPAEPAAIERPKSRIKIERGLMPRDHDELWRLSQIISRSGLAPKDLREPERIFVAIAHGLEVGLSPMASLQNVAVINGRPSLYGDVVLALAMRHPDVEDIIETPILAENGEVFGYECTVVRKTRSDVTRTFTAHDARRAGLAKKSGPWTEYPQRMLQMRARSWAIRDAVPDVLAGLDVVEEVIGVEPEDVATPAAAGDDLVQEAQLLLKDTAPTIMLDEDPGQEDAQPGDPEPDVTEPNESSGLFSSAEADDGEA